MAQNTQLRGLTEATFDFCEARKLCQCEYGVPQRDRFLVPGNVRNHWAKKGHPIGGRERNDRGPDVTPGAAEGEGGLGVEFGIPAGVICGRRKCRGQPNGTQHFCNMDHRAELPAHARTFGLIPVGYAIAFVEGSHGFTPQFSPYTGGNPQHAPAGRMAALVIRRELRGIVFMFVEET